MSQQPAETVGTLLSRLRPGRLPTSARISAKPNTFKKWPWIALGLLVGSPAPICGAVVIAYRIRIAHVAATLPDEIAKAKSDGLRFDDAYIKQAAHVDPSKNGAPLYRKVFGLIDQAESYDSSTSRFKHSLGRFPFSADIQSLLLDCDPDGALVEGIEAAAQSSDVDWRLRRDDEGYGIINESTRLGQMAGLLCALSMKEARDGSMAAALIRLQSAFKIARHVGRPPEFTAQGEREGIEENIYKSLGFILNLKLGSWELERIRAIIISQPLPRDLRTSLCYGLAESLHSMDEEAQAFKERQVTQESWGRDFPANLIHDYPAYWNAQKARALHYARLECKALEHADSFARASGAVARIGALYEADTFGPDDYYDVGGLPSGYFGSVTYRRLTLACIDLLLLRAKLGSFPPVLPTGDNFTDPFTGKPFVYKRGTGGFEIYSLGANLEDDSANPKLHTREDIAFAIKA